MNRNSKPPISRRLVAKISPIVLHRVMNSSKQWNAQTAAMMLHSMNHGAKKRLPYYPVRFDLALERAVQYGDTSAFAALVKNRRHMLNTQILRTLLVNAIIYRNASFVKLIIDLNATVPPGQQLPIDQIFIRQFIVTCVNSKFTEGVQFFFTLAKRHNLSPWRHEPSEPSYLYRASNNGDLPTVRFLLSELPAATNVEKHRALTYINRAVNAEHMENRGTALSVAYDKHHMDVFDELAKYGADVNKVARPKDATLLHKACMHDDDTMVAYLLERGANVNAQVTITEDDNPDEGGRGDETPLMIACERGNVKIVQMLLRKGATIGMRDEPLETALHKAVNSINEKLAAPVVKVLVDYTLRKNHAVLEYADSSGYTPLHFACDLLREDCIKVLIHAGANVNAKTTAGDTPLTLVLKSSSATRMKVLRIARLLLNTSRIKLSRVNVHINTRNTMNAGTKRTTITPSALTNFLNENNRTASFLARTELDKLIANARKSKRARARTNANSISKRRRLG